MSTANQIDLPEPTDLTAEALAEVDANGMNWDELSGEQGDDSLDTTVEGDLEIVNEAPGPVPDPVAEPAPAPAPVAQPAVPSAPIAQVAPVVPVQPAPVVPPVTPSQIPAIPVQPTVDIGAWEQEQITNLEQFYAINETDAQALQTEPELVMPKLAANMHMAVTKSIFASLQAMMPQMLQQHTEQMTVEQQARNDFFTANPDLAGQDAAVLQIGKMFRAANPTATKEQAVKMIGDMVRMSLGLPLQQAPQQNQPQQNLAGTMPMSTGTPSAPAIRPFTPSKTGGAAGSSVKAQNPWEELYRDDD